LALDHSNGRSGRKVARPASTPSAATRQATARASGLASRALDLVILAVATHSVAVGLCLLCFPMWTLKIVGWAYNGEVFWPSQAGLFLMILGSGYAAAIRYRPLVWLLIGSKLSAIVFLLAHVVFLDAPRLVILLGAGDGMMGLGVAALYCYVSRTGGRQEAGDRIQNDG
jgi:hypothetical protein